MAKLTRKIWAGIGAATIVGASLAGGAAAQDAHKGHKAPAPADQGAATKSAADGGEAYLTDGGPRDTRIRFYRDVGLMRGHMLVGRQLIALGLWDEALPHFLHPTEELYGQMDKYIKLHDMRPFQRELLALAQAVKAKRAGAVEQAQKAVDQKLDAAMGVARRFMNPLLGFTAKSAAELLKVAHSEYEASLEGETFVKPVEYQDSRGFVLEAERMFEAAAGELRRKDAEALARIRTVLGKLKTAWPAPMPPSAPVLTPNEVLALVSDIELHASRF
jgi:hypothetical protein